MAENFGPGILGGIVLVDPTTGQPYRASGAVGSGGSVTSDSITDATVVGRNVLKAVDAAAARTAIGAGISNLGLGTSGTTAAAGNDSRLSDARTPTAHAHSGADITSGTVPIARIPTGTSGTTVPLGNDARFSDARTPTAHAHPTSDVTGFAAAALSAAPAETVTTVGTLVSGATAKTTPIDADIVGVSDSVASNVLKGVTWANIKATLKAYFDTLYATVTHAHSGADITSGTVPIARIPTGTSGTTVALGNHTHSGYAATSHMHNASDINAGFLGLAAAPVGSRFVCLWNGTTLKWTYAGVDLNARPSARTDVFFVLCGAPAATTDPAWALSGDKREDV